MTLDYVFRMGELADIAVLSFVAFFIKWVLA